MGDKLPIVSKELELDVALSGFNVGIDRAVNFVTYDQIDMLAEFYLHKRAAIDAAEARIMSAITIAAQSDKIAEAEIAAAMWHEEAVDAGTPDSIAAGRTYEAFGDQSPELQARWLKFSRAALRALAGKGK